MKKTILLHFLLFLLSFNVAIGQNDKRSSLSCVAEEITFTVSDDIPLCDVIEVEITTDSPVDGEWVRYQGFATIENPTSKTTRITNLIYNNLFVVRWEPTLAECQTVKSGTDDIVTILTKESPKIKSITSVENDSNTNKLTADVEFEGGAVIYEWSTEDGVIESGQSTNEIIVSKAGTYTMKAMAPSVGIFSKPCYSEKSYKLETNNQEDYVIKEGFGNGKDSHDISPATTTYLPSDSHLNCPPQGPHDGRYVLTANSGLEFEREGGACGNRMVGDLFFEGWYQNVKDHTGDVNGRFLIINAATESGEFYKRVVSGLTVEEAYTINAWIANILNPETGCIPASPVNVSIEIYNGEELVASKTTGDVHASATIEEIWKEYALTFVANATEMIIVLRNNSYGGCGNDLAIDDIALRPSKSLGVSEYNSFKVGFEPNPVEDILTITSEETISQIEVFSFSGQSVLSQQGSGKSAVVDMSTLTSGVYIVKVYGGNSMETIKVVKE